MSPINFYYLRSFFCETAECPHNTYKDGSTFYCQPCPANSGHSLTGSVSVFDCKCFNGYEGRPESGNPCTGTVRKDLFWHHPHVIVRMFLKTEVFDLSQLPFCPHVNCVFGNQKHRVLFSIPREEIFENQSASRFFTLALEVSYIVILLALSILLKGCYRKSVIPVDGRKRFRYIGFVWTRFPC